MTDHPQLPEGTHVRLTYKRYVEWVEFPEKGGFKVHRAYLRMREIRAMRTDEKVHGLTIMPCGGSVSALIVDRTGRVISCGFARCRQDENFNRQIARAAAIGRALRRRSGGPSIVLTLDVAGDALVAVRRLAELARRIRVGGPL